MAGQAEFDARISRIAKRAARTPAARAAAMRRRRGGGLHRSLGLPISALIGVGAGWGGLAAAQLWLRPGAGDPPAFLAGVELGTLAMAAGPALAILAVILLGFGRLGHVAIAAGCSFGALQAGPMVLDLWPQIAAAPPPGWMVAAFAA